MSRTLRIGTRRSVLAMWQTEWVQSLLQTAHPDLQIEIHPITTQGDREAERSLAQLGGKGVFIKEIEDALLRNEIDIAIHSMKDVPTELPPGLRIGAIPERGDVRDVVATAMGVALADLPPAPRIGTGSERRRVQILNLRPDARWVDIRGNVDTRLRKLVSGDYDAIVLAMAGLQRLKREEAITEVLSIEQMVPAVGQAAVGVECRGDAPTLQLLASIEHPPTTIAVRAERAFLSRLGGGCRQPIGATAWVEVGAKHVSPVLAISGTLRIIGMVATEDSIRRESATGSTDNPEALGIQLAEKFL